jgi:anti-sigma-K factor RskA
MIQDEDNEALAAEYALGTLDADERAQAQARMEADAGFAVAVHSWERRLGELNVMVDPVEPPLHVWQRIREAIGGFQPSGEIRLPRVEPPPAAQSPGKIAPSNIVYLSRRVSRWRGVAAATSALAAALMLFVAAWEFSPEVLPERLRPPVRIVEVLKETQPARLVAVLQKDASGPAFLLTVDTKSRTLTMRRVTAEQEPGKSYELWLVSDRYPAPRSLGLVETGEFTQRPLLAAYDPATVNSATYAVSLEPEGGSPTGTPTGPVLYTGKLVEATPPAVP